MHHPQDSPALELEALGSVATQQRASWDHASNVVQRKEQTKAASDWIDERIRGDADVRGNPARVNLLHDLLNDDEPATTEQAAALAFTEMVESYASKAAVDPAATAAVELAQGIRDLAEGHEVLHLTLV